MSYLRIFSGISIFAFFLYFAYSLTPYNFGISIDAHNVSVGEFQAFEITLNISKPPIPKLPLLSYDIRILTNLVNAEITNESIFEISFEDMKAYEGSFFFKNVKFEKEWAFIYVIGEAVPRNELKLSINSKFLFFERKIVEVEKSVSSTV